jgi:hypothetical protein
MQADLGWAASGPPQCPAAQTARGAAWTAAAPGQWWERRSIELKRAAELEVRKRQESCKTQAYHEIKREAAVVLKRSDARVLK